MRERLRWFNRRAAGIFHVRIDGHLLGASSFDRLLYLWLHKLNIMGQAERAYFTRHLKPGMTILDVGANIGLYSLIFSRLTGPAGKVLSFEPEPDLYHQLARNLERNEIKNVAAYQQAAGAEASRQILSRDPLNSGNNHLVEPASTGSEGVIVEVTTVDSIVGAQKVDWIKIDVQGREPAVFAGMKETIRKNPTLRIYFEFWPSGLRRCGSDPAAFLTELEALGFQLHDPSDDKELTRGDFGTLAQRKGYFDLVAIPAQRADH